VNQIDKILRFDVRMWIRAPFKRANTRNRSYLFRSKVRVRWMENRCYF